MPPRKNNNAPNRTPSPAGSNKSRNSSNAKGRRPSRPKGGPRSPSIDRGVKAEDEKYDVENPKTTAEVGGGTKGHPPRVLSEEEQQQLKELLVKLRDSHNPEDKAFAAMLLKHSQPELAKKLEREVLAMEARRRAAASTPLFAFDMALEVFNEIGDVLLLTQLLTMYKVTKRNGDATKMQYYLVLIVASIFTLALEVCLRIFTVVFDTSQPWVKTFGDRKRPPLRKYKYPTKEGSDDDKDDDKKKEEEEEPKQVSLLSDPRFLLRHWLPALCSMIAEPNLGESKVQGITIARTFEAPAGVSKEEKAFYKEYNEITVGFCVPG